MKSSLAFLVGVSAIGLTVASAQSAEAFSVFDNRSSFQNQLQNSITDNYEAIGYKAGDIASLGFFNIFSDAAMSAVFGETRYTSTGFLNYNFVLDTGTSSAYCTGCNGSFLLDFTQTSIGTALGVFGAGFDILSPTNYFAFVTFGDYTTQNVSLSGSSFFGITSSKAIKNLRIGLENGETAKNGGIVIDNLTIGSAQAVPTPALLPGLIGMGVAALRKKGQEETVEEEA